MTVLSGHSREGVGTRPIMQWSCFPLCYICNVQLIYIQIMKENKFWYKSLRKRRNKDKKKLIFFFFNFFFFWMVRKQTKTRTKKKEQRRKQHFKLAEKGNKNVHLCFFPIPSFPDELKTALSSDWLYQWFQTSCLRFEFECTASSLPIDLLWKLTWNWLTSVYLKCVDYKPAAVSVVEESP